MTNPPSSRCQWRRCKALVRRMDDGADFGKGPDWERHVRRIAMLPEEIGKAIDRLGLCFRRARHVAYGATLLEQRRRLDKEAVLAEGIDLPTLVKEIDLPTTMRDASEEDLVAFAKQVAGHMAANDRRREGPSVRTVKAEEAGRRAVG